MDLILHTVSQLTKKHSKPGILYDQLGFGLSSHYPEQAGNETSWTAGVLVEQVHELIKYFVIGRRYDFLGHSFVIVIGKDLAAQPALRMGLRKHNMWRQCASLDMLNGMLQKAPAYT
jgi:pimeloyl-ACP methyl ester carboxylesterase